MACRVSANANGDVSKSPQQPVRSSKRPRARRTSELLAQYARAGRIEEMERELSLAMKRGFKLNSVNYTCIATAYARVNRFQQCFKTLAAMRDAGVPPTNTTMRFVINVCIKLKAGEHALAVLHTAQDWFVSDAIEMHEVKTWNMMMDAYAKLKCGDSAMKCLQLMMSSEKSSKIPCPDEYSFNICLNWLRASGKRVEVVDTFAQMLVRAPAFGVHPDTVTYNVLLQTALSDDYFSCHRKPTSHSRRHVIADSLEFAHAVESSMSRQNVQPDVQTRTLRLRLLTRSQPLDNECKQRMNDAFQREWASLRAAVASGALQPDTKVRSNSQHSSRIVFPQAFALTRPINLQLAHASPS